MGKMRTGFASMDPEKQKKIAGMGGREAHRMGTAHEFDSAEAREAGRKGGISVSRNREHMAAIGRIGGAKSKKRADGGDTRDIPPESLAEYTVPRLSSETPHVIDWSRVCETDEDGSRYE